MIRYKIDIIAALKEKGYNQRDILDKGLIPSQTLQNIRHGRMITLETLNKICIMLRCQPGDLVECVPTDEEKLKYF